MNDKASDADRQQSNRNSPTGRTVGAASAGLAAGAFIERERLAELVGDDDVAAKSVVTDSLDVYDDLDGVPPEAGEGDVVEQPSDGLPQLDFEPSEYSASIPVEPEEIPPVEIEAAAIVTDELDEVVSSEELSLLYEPVDDGEIEHDDEPELEVVL